MGLLDRPPADKPPLWIKFICKTCKHEETQRRGVKVYHLCGTVNKTLRELEAQE